MREIHFYKEFGDLGYLANYSNYGFTLNNTYYKTVEHYYQSEKFDNEEIKNKIINAGDAHEAARIGRDRCNIRKDGFDKIKLEVMYQGIYQKFKQNRSILYKLIETKNYHIFEDTEEEYFWGIGTTKTGENHIGIILEQVRNNLKQELLNETIISLKGKEINVIGHMNPDADSIFSSYLLNNIFNKLGINSHSSILNSHYEYDEKDNNIIIDYLKDQPKVITNTNSKYFVLVDHNNIIQSVNGNGTVLAAFDHHIITENKFNILEMEYASTGLLIYDLFKDKYKFNKYEKELILLTVLTDTDYLTSSRYTELDKELVNSLNLNMDIEKLQKKYFKVTDLNLDIETNVNKNYKKYEVYNTIINRTIITSYSNDSYNNYKEWIKNKKGNWLLIWCNYTTNRTYIYYNKNNYEYTIDKIITSTNLIIKDLKNDDNL